MPTARIVSQSRQSRTFAPSPINKRAFTVHYLQVTSGLPVTRAQSQEAVTIKVASTCFEFRVLHWASRRVQFVALGPKVLPVWFFDPILGELAGRALGCNDNTLAVTASHVRAEFQEEAIGRARRG